MIKGKKLRFGLAFLLFALVVSGCGPIVHSRALSLVGSGNFTQLIKEFEPPDRDFSKMPFSELIYLCSAYGGIKNYHNLFPCVDAAQEKVNGGNCHADFWDHSSAPLRIKAVAYIELGQYAEAIKAGEASYQIILDKDLLKYDQVKTLEVLGMAYGLAGMNYKAEVVIKSIQAILNAGNIGSLEDDINIALARIYITLKRYQDTIDRLYYKFEETNTFVKAITGWDVFMGTKIQFEFMKNKCFFEVGRLAEAKEGYDILLRYPYILNHGEVYWNILFDLGRIAKKEGKVKEAINYFTKAVEVVELQRASINTETSKIGFVGDKQALYHSLIQALYQKGSYETAFEYVERAKARALVDMLASRKRFARASASLQEEGDLIAKLDTAESEANIQDETITADQSSKQRAVVVKLKEEIRNTDPELASLVTVTSTVVAEIQQLLPSDETLVEYFGSGDSLFAFIVNREKIQGAKLEVKGLNQEIERFRKHIMVPDSYQFKANGQALYEKLIQPIEGMIGSKNLTIVPHGALHYLPFNALLDKDGFLIDRYSIRVLPSASVMQFLKDRREGHAGNLLAFGNPDLGDPSYDLPGAQNETIAITKDQPKSKLLLRKQATETAVKSFGDQFRYIHFATHGTFDAEKPLSSGLLLVGDSENDGILTVGELYDLHLPADLVTLSACETALGKVANGDDVVGFTRGFLYAGVSSIVSSLWKVDDKATSILMQQFYKSLKETDKRSALRTAQLKVKDTYNSHPYFWAAFQITGSLQ